MHASESVFFGLSHVEKFEVATAAKGSVELLNLSANTQEKDFYLIYTI